MRYGRIDLSKTNYQTMDNYVVFVDPPVSKLQKIYTQYCIYKKFESVVPLFDSQFREPNVDVFGYFGTNYELSAFSIVKRHDSCNAEALQFSWNYTEPTLRLGIRSLEHECAYYKDRGVNYLYLGVANEYKQQLDGFEFLGPCNV